MANVITTYVTDEQKDALDVIRIASRVPSAVRFRWAIDLIIKTAREDGLLPPEEDE
jgi:hypothetical protein